MLWLIPLAALARPRWRDFLIWQAGEVVYFVAIWWFLEGYGQPDNKALPEEWYVVAIAVHLLCTSTCAPWSCATSSMPEHDPVRCDGAAAPLRWSRRGRGRSL